MSSTRKDPDVLEQNVSTLLESGGEAPTLPAAARARIRAQLIARHGLDVPARAPVRRWRAIGLGLAATAAAAVIVTRLIGGGDAPGGTTQRDGVTTLADGSTWITDGAAKVTVLGERRVRVEGAALLDIAPGKGTFVVETAQGTIHVLGTRFLVDAAAERTTTAVVRGQVKLATSAGEVTLHAGEQAVAEPGRPPTRGPAPRLSHLVSWAAQARHKAETTVRPLRNGALFARDPGVRNGRFGEEVPLPLNKLGVDIVVENQVARVALDQTFFNAADRTLEGVYKFALPPDAALQRLAMYVDGKLTESAVVERMRARRIYEELVYRRVDPALLEWEGTGKLSLRVYPLPARQEKRVVLAYTQSVAKLYSDWSLTVPLPELDAPVGEVAFRVSMKGCANCEITSPSHAITVDRAGEDATVTYRKTGATIGDSLVLRVRDARQQATAAAQIDGSERYLMVRSPAELPREARAYRPKTWVILDDVSASRGALERRAQADLIDAFVRELDEDDRLAVVAFDVTARTKLSPTRVMDVDRRALRAALADEGDVGATDVTAALTAATELLAGTPPDDAMIVYLGDGVITSGTHRLDALRAQLAGKARFVGVGVGDGADTQTLEALAAATGGYATTMDLADDLGWRAFDLVAALHTSRVTGVEARLVDASGQLVPATAYLRSPQLADGEELELVAKLAGDGVPAAVELTGTASGAPWRQRIALERVTTGAGYLPRLWAQRHLAARLLAKHEPVTVPPCVAARPPAKGEVCKTEAQAREERDEAIRKEVVELGKRYFLLSRHTSLIVLENNAMYAQYGVRKGAGDTWAPYALPPTIPVTTATTRAPVDAAPDAEMVRPPLALFAAYGSMINGANEWSVAAPTPSLGTLERQRATGESLHTRSQLELAQPVSGTGDIPVSDADTIVEKKSEAPRVIAKSAGWDRDESELGDLEGERRIRVSAGEFRVHIDHGWLSNGVGEGRGGTGGPLVPSRLAYPTDVAFDDLSMLVPALFADDSDAWRAQLEAAAAAPVHPIDPAAQALLARARATLPQGVYRWGDRELAVDAAHRLGWRRTSDLDMLETASFDGTTFTRRYAELGLDVTRPVTSDDVALSLAYLPLWIAEPAHYARWFAVGTKGPLEVTLSSLRGGKPQLRFVLGFDAAGHLVAIRDGADRTLVAITWTAAGPVAAQASGRAIAVGFTGQAIADAAAWAHGTTPAQRAVVELPLRMPAYWAARAAGEQPGTPAWRSVQRRYLASLAAVGDRPALFAAYEALRQHGGVELGDVVLASGGLATAATDKQLAAALEPVAFTPVARYLIVGRAFGKQQLPERMKPEVTTGALGALWQLREAMALQAVGKSALAIDRLVAMGTRAPLLRLVGIAASAGRYGANAEDIIRGWTSVATGPRKNVARANAVEALYQRGAYEQAAAMAALMVDDLDLTADAPYPTFARYALQSSRRGPAGWQLVWATWRDKVLAGTSWDHTMTLYAYSGEQAEDQARLFERLVTLAAGDPDRTLVLIELALGHNQPQLVRGLVDQMLANHPTTELYARAAQIALSEHRTADAFALLEKAQTAGADETVTLTQVRAELGQLIMLAKQLALEVPAARADAVRRALSWGAKWRAIDPGNPEIDLHLGALLLAVGDKAEAWRQLSGVIERDPMSGAGYMTVAETFEQQGRVADALDYWQQAIVIEQTNPTPRVRKAQALYALGRTQEGDVLLAQVANGTWHEMWSGQVYQAKELLARGK